MFHILRYLRNLVLKLLCFCNSHEKAKEAVMYSYNKHINGFAALLEDEEASKIESE